MDMKSKIRAVSYTHLDVYKRQPLFPGMPRSRNYRKTQAVPQRKEAQSLGLLFYGI